MNIRRLQLQGLIEHHVHKAHDGGIVAHLLQHLEALYFFFLSLPLILFKHLTAQLLNEILKRIPLLILVFDQLNNRHRITHP